MDTLTAADLAQLVNCYTITQGRTHRILVPQAQVLAGYQEVTVSGTLLKKQTIQLDPATNQRTTTLAKNGGAYHTQEKDGDLHFCLGTTQGEPHIACELQNAAPWISTFDQAIGQDITVSGFFRCLFEHPGFKPRGSRITVDAHIFEIHPVRAVSFNGTLQSFDIDIPNQVAIHTWTDPHNLNDKDSLVSVHYDGANDVLTFSDMPGMDENYVSVGGQISNVQLNEGDASLASFTLTSPDVTNPLQVYCLKGSSAALQLGRLQANGSTGVALIALRNIDLTQALQDQYSISLLAIDIQAT